jgi:cytochrome c oxidase subunit I+III
LLVVGAFALVAAIGVEIWGHWQTGLTPTQSAYGAMVYTAAGLSGQVAAAVLLMALVTAARLIVRRTDKVRRNSFDHTKLLAWYCVAQGLLGLVLIHGFPRAVA